MKLDGTISYNGFTFAAPTAASAGAPLDGAQIETIRFTDVDAVGYLDKRALNDGLDAVDVFLGGRAVLISAAVYGSTEGRLWDNLTDLCSAFDPVIAYNADSANRGFVPFRFVRQTADTATWAGGSLSLRMDLRPARIPSFTVRRRNTGGVSARGDAIPVDIQLIARDPRIFLQSTTSLTVSTSAQTGIHRGTHPVYPSFVLTMSGSGSSATVISVDGFSVKLDLSSVSTGTYDLSYTNRHMIDSDGNSRDDLFASGFTQQFMQMQPGGSVIQGFNLTNVTIVATWREAWL